jgi:hypothetical protein
MKVYNTSEPDSGKMFRVIMDKNKILVYKISDNSQVYEIKNYKKVFAGKNSKKYGPSSKSHTGLSILVEIKEKEYVFISHKIQQFKTLEPIKKFYSQMGNNAFLYPFALTDNYAYLIIENKYIKRDFGDLDPYEVYYDFKKVWNRKSHNFSMKNIKYSTKLNGGGKRNGYDIKLTTTYVDIQHSKGLVKKGWFRISISKDRIFIYISRDNNRIYWSGNKKGNSDKLSIKFDDQKKLITINNSNKIKFYKSKDYETIKQKTIYYKHMKEDENNVVFQEKNRR